MTVPVETEEPGASPDEEEPLLKKNHEKKEKEKKSSLERSKLIPRFNLLLTKNLFVTVGMYSRKP